MRALILACFRRSICQAVQSTTAAFQLTADLLFTSLYSRTV